MPIKMPAMLDVRSCARCGQDHDKLVFQPFQEPEHSACLGWALCPTYGEPILLREELDPMSNELRTLAIEYDAALAAGDRPRLIAVFRRIVELIGSVDQEKLGNWIEFIKKLLEWLPAAPTDAHSLGSFALTTEEATAAGLTDNVMLWVQLVQLLIEFFRRARG